MQNVLRVPLMSWVHLSLHYYKLQIILLIFS